MSNHSLAQYYAAVSSAIRADDTKAVPGLLILMAQDGFGPEAETLRRDMVLVLDQLASGLDLDPFAISGPDEKHPPPKPATPYPHTTPGSTE